MVRLKLQIFNELEFPDCLVSAKPSLYIYIYIFSSIPFCFKYFRHYVLDLICKGIVMLMLMFLYLYTKFFNLQLFQSYFNSRTKGSNPGLNLH